MLYGCLILSLGLKAAKAFSRGRLCFAISTRTVDTYIQSHAGSVTGEEVVTLDHLQAGRRRESDNKLLGPLCDGLMWKKSLSHCDDIVRDLLREGVDDGLRMSRYE